MFVQDLNAQLDKAEADVSEAQGKMRETEVALIKTKEELSQVRIYVHTYVYVCMYDPTSGYVLFNCGLASLIHSIRNDEH